MPPILTNSAILADFGGIGVLILVAVLAASVVLSVGVAAFDRRIFQFVFAATSCLFFCLFCIVFILAVLGLLQADHYPPFGLMIPPITAIQFVLYALRLRRSSRR
jgi:hypothetical protein